METNQLKKTDTITRNIGEDELVDVVDKNDRVVGNALKTDVYRNGLSNRIVHVFVVDPESGSIFIQKRGESVRYLPGYYCTSAGGHVGSGEDYDVAAKREMKEEIGIDADIQFIEKFVYDCPETNPATPRFISLYIAYVNKGFKLSKDEVSEGFFITVSELEEILEKDICAHPQLAPCYEVYRRSGYFVS